MRLADLFQVRRGPRDRGRAFVASPGLALRVRPDQRMNGVAAPARTGDEEAPGYQLVECGFGLARPPGQVLLVPGKDHPGQQGAGEHDLGGERVQTRQDVPLEIGAKIAAARHHADQVGVGGPAVRYELLAEEDQGRGPSLAEAPQGPWPPWALEPDPSSEPPRRRPRGE